jgi:hypothetical protein
MLRDAVTFVEKPAKLDKTIWKEGRQEGRQVGRKDGRKEGKGRKAGHGDGCGGGGGGGDNDRDCNGHADGGDDDITIATVATPTIPIIVTTDAMANINPITVQHPPQS